MTYPCLEFISTNRYQYCNVLFYSSSLCGKQSYQLPQHVYHTSIYLGRRSGSEITDVQTGTNINEATSDKEHGGTSSDDETISNRTQSSTHSYEYRSRDIQSNSRLGLQVYRTESTVFTARKGSQLINSCDVKLTKYRRTIVLHWILNLEAALCKQPSS